MKSFKKKITNPLKSLALPKKSWIALVALILGGTSLTLALTLFNPLLSESEASRVETLLPVILLDVKKQTESKFTLILDEIRDDELGELLTGKMPTTEEIFFSEWANDQFPLIDIPIYGPIIEEFGAEMVGDINLDGVDPIADLNISSNYNPSDLNFIQCKALWNLNRRYSLVSRSSSIWFKALLGNLDSQITLQTNFNLTKIQLDQICTWINISSTGWMENIVHRYDLKPLIFTVLIISGTILAGFGFLLLWSLRSEIKIQGLGIFKKKGLKSVNFSPDFL
ncbi:MAG: hypothetical protein ACXABG_06070 [Promethearchaeota archaeon]